MIFLNKKLWLIFIVAAHAPLVSAMEGESDNPYSEPVKSSFAKLVPRLDLSRIQQDHSSEQHMVRNMSHSRTAIDTQKLLENSAAQKAEPNTTITKTQRLKNFGSGVLKSMSGVANGVIEVFNQLLHRTPKTPEQQEAADLQKSTEDKIKEHEKENGAFDSLSSLFDKNEDYANKLKQTQDIFANAKETAQMDAEKTGKRVVLAKPTVASGNDMNPRFWKFHIIDLSELNADLENIVDEEYLEPATGKKNIEELNTRLKGLAERIKLTQGTDLSTPEIINELIEHINNNMGLNFNEKEKIPLVEIKDPQTTLNRLTTLIGNKIPAVQDWVQKNLTKNSTAATEEPAGNQAVQNSPYLNEVI